jgi:cyanophycinase-like exopeptidase
VAEGRTFLLMGSGEFEPWSEEVERAALQGARGDGSVAIVPTASFPDGQAIFERWGTLGLAHYEAMGVTASVVPIRDRSDAMREELASQVADASMVFFSGGKPRYLAEVIGGTPVWDGVLTALDRGAVFVGCSAGAMIASHASDGKERLGGAWLLGLGLIANMSFGVHWDKVRYIPGMRPFLMRRVRRDGWFVGIDERTAILGDGNRWTVFGNRTAMVRGMGRTRSFRAGESFATAG